ncbi:hypothetical protein Pmani_005337 [Petrolisthes manimaculis]|uniref:Uncharacterized protein n=1 Tax=Petrolisthes manimaculis TaxID=1843537 RepID=A0AAE1UN11_9EUCA|nr:hypothetical protein Pmani_005337 [Petrolisthes manimaculis]
MRLKSWCIQWNGDDARLKGNWHDDDDGWVPSPSPPTTPPAPATALNQSTTTLLPTPSHSTHRTFASVTGSTTSASISA